MDKVMKEDVDNILMKFYDTMTDAKEGEFVDRIYNRASSSLTALIIKWLEEHKVSAVGGSCGAGRNQLITELIGEVK